jgi:hypothetical protein
MSFAFAVRGVAYLILQSLPSGHLSAKVRYSGWHETIPKAIHIERLSPEARAVALNYVVRAPLQIDTRLPWLLSPSKSWRSSVVIHPSGRIATWAGASNIGSPYSR